MCPGLVNPGSELNEDYEIGQSVVVYAEGKEHALAVGHLKVRRRRREIVCHREVPITPKRTVDNVGKRVMDIYKCMGEYVNVCIKMNVCQILCLLLT